MILNKKDYAKLKRILKKRNIGPEKDVTSAVLLYLEAYERLQLKYNEVIDDHNRMIDFLETTGQMDTYLFEDWDE